MNYPKFPMNKSYNPFRKPTYRLAFDLCVKSFHNCEGAIRRDSGARINGNSIATEFWRGYDGVANRYITRTDKDSLGYVYWRAGRACKKASCPPITYATRCG